MHHPLAKGEANGRVGARHAECSRVQPEDELLRAMPNQLEPRAGHQVEPRGGVGQQQACLGARVHQSARLHARYRLPTHAELARRDDRRATGAAPAEAGQHRPACRDDRRRDTGSDRDRDPLPPQGHLPEPLAGDLLGAELGGDPRPDPLPLFQGERRRRRRPQQGLERQELQFAVRSTTKHPRPPFACAGGP